MWRPTPPSVERYAPRSLVVRSLLTSCWKAAEASSHCSTWHRWKIIKGLSHEINWAKRQCGGYETFRLGFGSNFIYQFVRNFLVYTTNVSSYFTNVCFFTKQSNFFPTFASGWSNFCFKCFIGTVPHRKVRIRLWVKKFRSLQLHIGLGSRNFMWILAQMVILIRIIKLKTSWYRLASQVRCDKHFTEAISLVSCNWL